MESLGSSVFKCSFFGAPFIAITDYEGMECFFDPRLVSSQYVVLLFCAKDLYSVLFWPRVISRAFYREKIVICLPTKPKHLAALENVRAFQIAGIGLTSVGF